MSRGLDGTLFAKIMIFPLSGGALSVLPQPLSSSPSALSSLLSPRPDYFFPPSSRLHSRKQRDDRRTTLRITLDAAPRLNPIEIVIRFNNNSALRIWRCTNSTDIRNCQMIGVTFALFPATTTSLAEKFDAAGRSIIDTPPVPVPLREFDGERRTSISGFLKSRRSRARRVLRRVASAWQRHDFDLAGNGSDCSIRDPRWDERSSSIYRASAVGLNFHAFRLRSSALIAARYYHRPTPVVRYIFRPSRK